VAKLVKIAKPGGGFALGRVNGKLITDVGGAPCCCNPGDWREAISCANAEDSIYIPSASTCTGDGTSVAGMVIVYGPGCWGVSNTTTRTEDLPPDAVLVEDTSYECVQDCLDDACGADLECCRSVYTALIVPGVNGADISNRTPVILGSEPGWRERLTLTFRATKQFPGYFDSMELDIDVEILVQGLLQGSDPCLANVVRETAGGAQLSATPNLDPSFAANFRINTDRININNGIPFNFTSGGLSLKLWELVENNDPFGSLVWLEPNPSSSQPLGWNLDWASGGPGRDDRIIQMQTMFPFYVPYGSASGPGSDHRDGDFSKYMRNSDIPPTTTSQPEYRNLSSFSYSSSGRVPGGGFGSLSSSVAVATSGRYDTITPNYMQRQIASAAFLAQPLSASMSMTVDTLRVEPLASGGEFVESLFLTATNTGSLILNGPCNPNLGRPAPPLPPGINPETMQPYTQPGKCYGCGQ
jgi:hypothetical protein